MAVLPSLYYILLAVLALLFALMSPKNNGRSPPLSSEPRLQVLGSLLRRPPTVASLSALLGRLHAAHGPVVSLCTGGGKPAVFIARHDLAHRTLVRMGAAFAQRPPSRWSAGGVNGYAINSAAYGGRWAILRRNLAAHLAADGGGAAPRLFIDWLVRNLDLAVAAAREGGGAGVVVPSEIIRHAVFRLFFALCFGEDDGDVIARRLRGLHAEILALVVELDAFHLMPVVLQLTHYVPRWRKLFDAQKRHRAVVTALIDARRRRRREDVDVINDVAEHHQRCYVDTLLKLGLRDDEMVSLCWEFMNAAVKTTTVALEWIMARLVLQQDIQQKLYDDIVTRRSAGDSTCSTAGERPFVEAVVLEALRRHPPAHYLLAHTTDKDVSVDGYVIRKGSVVNYGVAEIGRDAKIWTDPDAFRPERFMEGGEGAAAAVPGICISSGGNGGRETEMKMMPFGAGRRACPGAAVAVKVLQAFTEELITRFEWSPVEDATVDMAEKPGLVTEMKTPLRTRLVRRQQHHFSNSNPSVANCNSICMI